MVMRYILLFLCFFYLNLFAQSSLFDLNQGKETYGTYAVKIEKGQELPKEIHYKYSANGWDYVLAERSDIIYFASAGIFSQVYIESGRGYELNDSSLVTHSVPFIHLGQGGLPDSYTGKGVVIGYVDTGCDVTHGDFIDALGNSRVIRYWDQTASVNARTPVKYGYGQVYDSSDINAGVYPNYAGSGHGTTVAGAGSGNGLANGRNKGVAPESDIIIVKSPLSGSNFSLTVAEAVDFVFCVADSLGIPAVVNLSLGSYLGSHDGLDPAGLYIDSLLNEKPGRIVVCAAGNSGNWGKYHVEGHNVNGVDTSFVWMIPNPSFAYGEPGVYIDLWADTSEVSNMQIAFGADAPGPVFRGSTDFHQCGSLYNIDIIDTIWGSTSFIGELIFNERVIGPNYNLRALVFTDSLTYKIRFMTKGDVKYDAWSHVNLGLSNFETSIPSTITHPEFEGYFMPDSLQTIVTSWACSEKVITVANMQNRQNYVDFDGNVYPVDGGLIPSGKLSANSSKGPNRRGALKPDITAAGDMTLSARVMNEAYAPTQLDEGGLHVRNGGTSMASPVVAGIAALYLEKCPNSTWEDFKNDLYNGAYSDSFITGGLPNYAFGMGKVNALETLLGSNFESTLLGDTLLCSQEGILTIEPEPFGLEWSEGQTDHPLIVSETNLYFAIVTNEKGCKSYTDTLQVIAGTMPYPSLITQLDGALIATVNDNYQWYLSGEEIVGATSQTHFPEIAGNYMVSVSDPSGCIAYSDEINVGIASLKEEENTQLIIYPNPVSNEFYISSDEPGNYEIVQLDGKMVQSGSYSPNEGINVNLLANGLYSIKLVTNYGLFETKLIKY